MSLISTAPAKMWTLRFELRGTWTVMVTIVRWASGYAQLTGIADALEVRLHIVGVAALFAADVYGDLAFVAAHDVDLSGADAHFKLPAGRKVRQKGMVCEIVNLDLVLRETRNPQQKDGR